MPDISRTQRVRQLISASFIELGSTSACSLNETLMIRDGHYCGHRFQSGDMSAVWFLEEEQIKLYGADGGLLKVISPAAVDQDSRSRAA